MTFEARLDWADGEARHVDRLLVGAAALRADGRWQRAGEQASQDGVAELDAAPWVQPAGLAPVDLPAAAFRLRVAPRAGRHYPRLAFPALAQGARDLRPVRLLAGDATQLRVDPNHPLAGRGARLILCPDAREAAPGARLADLFAGPGMQAPMRDVAATLAEGVARQDDADDAAFYAQPRFTQHLDAACRAEISRLYARFLAPGARVLDLMSSWVSHLPETPADLHVAGLGMNAAELAANPRLAEQVVKDLNARAGLPWNDGQFDLAICTASIEYLVAPHTVMREVLRVLKPGGRLLVTFSDRWFPTKAIRVWSELHPWERLGLVLGLLREAGFVGLRSETLRGLARAADDKYAAERAHADPLFAAWGEKAA